MSDSVVEKNGYDSHGFFEGDFVHHKFRNKHVVSDVRTLSVFRLRNVYLIAPSYEDVLRHLLKYVPKK